MLMRVGVLLAVLGCTKDREAPPAPVAPAVAAPPPIVVDAGVPRSLIANPTKLVADAHYFSDDEPLLFVDGGFVYWWRAPDGEDAALHRVPRGGGANERVEGRAVYRGVTYKTESAITKRVAPDQPVTLLRLAGGKHVRLGVAKGGLGGKQFRFDGEHVYWIAPWSSGFGSLFATHLTTGATARLLACKPSEDSDCPEVLRGSPVLARQKERIYRLERGRATQIATCPADPVTKVVFEATQALGDHVLCEILDIGSYDMAKSTKPEAVLVPLSDPARPPRPSRGLGQHAAFAGGHWYHATDAGIVRRSILDGADEVVVTLPQGAKKWIDALVVDEHGLVWIDGTPDLQGSVWTAPLPP